MFNLRYAVLGLAVVAILWPSQPPKASGRLAGTEWHIVEIEGIKAISGGTLRFTQSTVRGKADCNAFFGAFRERADEIEIGGLNATRMACAGSMDREPALLSALQRAKFYRIDAHGLLLIDVEGKTLLRLRD